MAAFMRAHIDDADFAARFDALKAMKREQSVDVNAAVGEIIADVRARGDAALIELTQKYDRVQLSADALRFSDAEIDAAMSACDGETRAALELAATRISDFHMPAKNPKTSASPMRAASSWAIVGHRLMRPVCMCRAGWPIIPHRF